MPVCTPTAPVDPRTNCIARVVSAVRTTYLRPRKCHSPSRALSGEASSGVHKDAAKNDFSIYASNDQNDWTIVSQYYDRDFSGVQLLFPTRLTR
jgi:hypothetical protein